MWVLTHMTPMRSEDKSPSAWCLKRDANLKV